MTEENEGSSLSNTAQRLISRSNKLLREMEQLRQTCQTLKGPDQRIPGLASLTDAVQQERKSAASVLATLHASGRAESDPGAADTQAAETRLRFTNLGAIERNWHVLKRCKHLVSIEQSIPKLPKTRATHNGGLVGHQRRHGKPEQTVDTVFVHIITDGGAEWLRIVSKDEKQIGLDLAAAAWKSAADEAQQDEDKDEDDAHLYEDIPLLRISKDLADAARNHWHEYRRPRVRILLARIRSGQSLEISRLVQMMRQAGGHDISLSIDYADVAWYAGTPAPNIDTALSALLPAGVEADAHTTVLIDTSVLIALVSDISHTVVDARPWHRHGCRAQIQSEAAGTSFLKLQAYPQLRGRRLVCTREALARFQAITSTIASRTELQRSSLLFNGACVELQTLSIHPVPADLLLPVHVLPDLTKDLCAEDLVRQGRLPAVAEQVERHLLAVPANRATHLYGWSSGTTVVTSNKTLAHKMVRMIEDSLTTDCENGPKIHALSYNRALATRGPDASNQDRQVTTTN